MATSAGGAINNMNNLVLSSDIFTSNSATTGAAVANFVGGDLTISESTFTLESCHRLRRRHRQHRHACDLQLDPAEQHRRFRRRLGPGIHRKSDADQYARSFLTRRTAAAASRAAGPATLINVTIARNNVSGLAGGGGGISLTAGGKAGLYNSIVAQNFTGTGQFAPASDIALSGGGSLVPNSANNLIGTGGSGGLTSGGDTGNLVGIANPGLASSLQLNGGPTETLALVAGSPAIDAGRASIVGVNLPTIDQRGALRGPKGLEAGPTTDIGAYEASSSYLVSTTAVTLERGYDRNSRRLG